MSAAPKPHQTHRRGRLAPAHVTVALSETLAQHEADTAAVEQAQTVWQTFLTTAAPDSLSGSVASWCAALHYMAATRTGQKLRQKDVSQHYRISLSTLSQRLALLKTHTNYKQSGPASVPIQLDDAEWIGVFRATHRLLSHLYAEKTHIEIVRYLRHVELNVELAGYTISPDRLQEQFCRLFARVGLQPVKGRDARKFVFLQDIWGLREPFVLLKLGYQDG